MRFAMVGQFTALSWSVVVGCGAVFFVAALWGYDPQRGWVKSKGGGG
jgi:ABC-2 type transport system permease protein